MALTKKTEPRKTSDGIAFDVLEVGRESSYRVEVTGEAIEDFCDPRGIDFDQDGMPPPALYEAIMFSAEKLIQRAQAGTKTVLVDTKTLNG